MQHFWHIMLYYFKESTLAGVAQWIEHQPENKNVPSSIQSGHVPGLRARFPVGGMGDKTHPCISHTLVFLSLSLPFLISKKKYFF